MPARPALLCLLSAFALPARAAPPLAAAEAQLRARRPLAASAAALAELQEAASPQAAREAHLVLAQALDQLDLPEAARVHRIEALAGPTDSPAARRTAEAALVGLLARELDALGGDPALAAAVATLPPDALAPSLQPAVLTLQGLAALQAGDAGAAAAALALADTPQADLAHAVLAQARGAPQTAARHLLRARRRAADPRAPAPALHDLATLDLARLMHAHGRTDHASALYLSVPPGRPDWARAREELAWTWLLAGAPDRALGAALALEAPLAAAALEPEAALVAGIVRIEACHWKAAVRGAEALVSRLAPVIDQLETWSGAADPTAAWTDPALHPGLRAAAHRDALLATALDRRAAIAIERAQIAQTAARRWRETVGAVLEAELAAEQARVEAVARDRSARVLAQERARLVRVVDDAQVLAFEATDGARRALEAQARTGAAAPPAQAPDAVFTAAPTVVAWPWNGEFWEDELDGYRVSLVSACGAAG